MEEQLRQIILDAMEEFFKNKPESHTEVLKIKELSKAIGKSTSWIRQHRSELPAVISDKPLLWHKKDIENWLEEKRKPVEKSKIITPNFEVNLRKA